MPCMTLYGYGNPEPLSLPHLPPPNPIPWDSLVPPSNRGARPPRRRPPRAVVACPGVDGETLGQRADALLEWLCLHLEEDELPKGFDPRGRNLDVIRPGQNFGAAAAAPAVASAAAGNTGEGGGRGSPLPGVDAEPVESVQGRLLGYGFGHAEVAGAISAAKGKEGGGGRGAGEDDGGDRDSLDARTLGPLEVLARGLAATAGSVRKPGGPGGGGRGGGVPEEVQTEEEGREATDEEVMSLEAIYDGAVAVAPHMPEVTTGQEHRALSCMRARSTFACLARCCII